jgi:hypothetical protein
MFFFQTYTDRELIIFFSDLKKINLINETYSLYRWNIHTLSTYLCWKDNEISQNYIVSDKFIQRNVSRVLG